MEKTPPTNSYWAEFIAASGVTGVDYTVVAFGDASELADELVELVLSGTKRATASLVRDYACGEEPMPKVGDFVVVVDGVGTPRCIWRHAREGERDREWRARDRAETRIQCMTLRRLTTGCNSRRFAPPLTRNIRCLYDKHRIQKPTGLHLLFAR